MVIWDNNDKLWNNFDNLWSSTSWDSFIWNNFSKDIDSSFDALEKTFDQISMKAKSNTIDISGIIVFSYKVNDKFSFKDNWDVRKDKLLACFKENAIKATIDIESGEYDRITNIVKAEINFSYKSVTHDTCFISKHILNCVSKARTEYHIIFNKIFLNDHGLIYENDVQDIYEVVKQNNELKNKVAEQEIISEKETKPQLAAKVTKYLKLLDESKKRYKNSTFEIIKQITEIDGIPVNCLIVKQIRGTKDRKKYTLNANDCELLNIDYKDGLEILPNDLEYENVYKRVKNENYKEP